MMGVRKTTVVLAVVGALILASCGNDNETAGEGKKSEEPTKAALVFGTINTDQSDAGVAFPGPPAGFEAWAEYVNDSGGIDGHPVEIRSCNDKSTPEGSQTCARKQVDDKNVLAIGGSLSNQMPVALPILAEASLAYVGMDCISPAEYTSPAAYCIGTGLAAVANVTEQAVKGGAKNVVLLMQDSDAARQAVPLFQGIVIPLGGEVTPVYAPAASPDYVPALTEALSHDPDVIFLGVAPLDMTRVLQASDTLGNEVPFIAPGGGIDEGVLKSGAASLEGLTYNADFPTLDTSDPDVKTYQDYLKSAGQADMIGDSSLGGWVSGLVLEAAVKAIGPDKVTRESLYEYLRTQDVKGVPMMPAVLSLKNPPKLGDVEFSSIANTSTYMVKIVDGKPQLSDERVDTDSLHPAG